MASEDGTLVLFSCIAYHCTSFIKTFSSGQVASVEICRWRRETICWWIDNRDSADEPARIPQLFF